MGDVCHILCLKSRNNSLLSFACFIAALKEELNCNVEVKEFEYGLDRDEMVIKLITTKVGIDTIKTAMFENKENFDFYYQWASAIAGEDVGEMKLDSNDIFIHAEVKGSCMAISLFENTHVLA